MQKNKKAKQKSSKSKGTKQKRIGTPKIEDTEYNIALGEKALFVNYGEKTFVTSKNIAEMLLNGKLKTKDKKIAKAVQLGVFGVNGIENDTGVFLTVKGKAVYFSPKKDLLLVSSVSSLKKLYTGEEQRIKLGKIVSK